MNNDYLAVITKAIILVIGIMLGYTICLGQYVDQLDQFSNADEAFVGDTDPSCDYNKGVKNSKGLATCNLDYKTKVHGDQGKTIDAHCENGYVASAEMVSSDDDCFEHMQDNEQNFFNCADTLVEKTCGWKWQNWCATNHHVTTKSITCAPTDDRAEAAAKIASRARGYAETL